MASNTNWGALSIQDRIRAMNDTLDKVEQKKSDEETTSTSGSPPPPPPEQAASLPPKRSSVVDIWRKREGGASVEKPVAAKQSTHPMRPNTISPSAQRNHTNSIQEKSLNEVKTALASRFQNTQQQHSFAAINQNEEDESHSSSSSTLNKPKWGGSNKMSAFPSRRIDSATPTPPQVPGSNRKNKWGPAVQESAGELEKEDKSNAAQEPVTPGSVAKVRGKADSTVSVGAEENLSPTCSHRSDNGSEASTPESTATVPTQRRSVVDIWKTRASPSPSEKGSATMESPSAVKSTVSPVVAGKPPLTRTTSPPPIPFRKWSPKPQPQQEPELEFVPSHSNSPEAKSPPRTITNRWAHLKAVPLTDSQRAGTGEDGSVAMPRGGHANENADDNDSKVQTPATTPGKVTDRWKEVVATPPTKTADSSKVGAAARGSTGKVTDRWIGLERNNSASSLGRQRSPSPSSGLPRKTVADRWKQSSDSPSNLGASAGHVSPIPSPRTTVADRWNAMRQSNADATQEPSASTAAFEAASPASSPGQRSPSPSGGVPRKTVADRWNAMRQSNSDATHERSPAPSAAALEVASPGKSVQKSKASPSVNGEKSSTSVSHSASEVEDEQKHLAPIEEASPHSAPAGNDIVNENGPAATPQDPVVESEDGDLDDEKTEDGDNASARSTLLRACRVSDRWTQAANSSPSPVPLDKNISDLVKEHAARTPTGKIRNKLSGSWKEATTDKADNAAPGSLDFTVSKQPSVSDDSVENHESADVSSPPKESGPGTNKKSLSKGSPPLLLAVDENVAAIVKEHAARTPSGQKRNRLSDRWKDAVASPKSSSSPAPPSDDDNVDQNPSVSPTADKQIEIVKSVVEAKATTTPKTDVEESSHSTSSVADDGKQASDTTPRANSLQPAPAKNHRESIADRWNKRVATAQTEEADINGIDSSMASPLNIIDAWADNAASAKSSPPSNVIRSPSGNAKEAAPVEMSESADCDESKDDLTSPFQIIEEWSDNQSFPKASDQRAPSPTKSNAPPSSAKRMASPPAAKSDDPPPAAKSKAPVSKASSSSVQLVQASAFAPWIISDEQQPLKPPDNSALSESSEKKNAPPTKARKNLTMLGRKHLAHRVPQKEKSQETKGSTVYAESIHSNGREAKSSSKSEEQAAYASKQPLKSRSQSPGETPSKLNESSARKGIAHSAKGPSVSLNRQTPTKSMDTKTGTPTRSRSPHLARKPVASMQQHHESPSKGLSGYSLPRKKRHGPSDHQERQTRTLGEDKGTPLSLAAPRNEDPPSVPVSKGPGADPPLKARNTAQVPGSPAQESSLFPTTTFDDPSFCEEDIAQLTEPSSTESSTLFTKQGTSSVLTNKAGKALRDRRQKNVEKNFPPPEDEETELDRILAETADFSQSTSRKAHLKDRYRRTSRFLDSDVVESEEASTVVPDGTSDVVLTESMSLQSHESATSATGSEIPYQFDEAPFKAKSTKKTSRRKNRSFSLERDDPAADVSICKSVDGVKEMASSFFPSSFDFGKLASVVDEQFSAFRDLVGTANEKPKTNKRQLSIPQHKNLDPFDAEDVAIEVECAYHHTSACSHGPDTARHLRSGRSRFSLFVLNTHRRG